MPQDLFAFKQWSKGIQFPVKKQHIKKYPMHDKDQINKNA